MSLREAAEQLGVHYMTIYRYVRLGQLPATKEGKEWRVQPADVAALRSRPQPGRRGKVDWSNRFFRRLVGGDEPGAWKVVEAALASGHEPVDVYLAVVAPAMRRVGKDWADGKLDIAVEHRASAITSRIVGRLGAMMRPRGRRKGTIVLGSPSGERHSLPLAIVGDIMRAAGYEVMDLGADVPDASFERAVAERSDVVAVGVGVSSDASLPAARRLIKRLRRTLPEEARVIAGGAAVGKASDVGADFVAADAAAAVAYIEENHGR